MRDRGDGICRIPSDSYRGTLSTVHKTSGNRTKPKAKDRGSLSCSECRAFVVLSPFDALHAILDIKKGKGPIYLVFIRARGPH